MRGLHNICTNQTEPGGKQMDQKGARGAADTERSTQTEGARSMRSERGGKHPPSDMEAGHVEPNCHAGYRTMEPRGNPSEAENKEQQKILMILRKEKIYS